MNNTQLKSILKRAAEAHHVYEAQERILRGDETWSDPAWAAWYAVYILSMHPALRGVTLK